MSLNITFITKTHSVKSLIFVCCVLSGHALIRYSNLGSAVYAKEKLNGFEYPPGNRLAVNFFDDGEDRCRYSHMHVYIVNILKVTIHWRIGRKCPERLIHPLTLRLLSKYHH